jgi:hypothetical protein
MVLIQGGSNMTGTNCVLFTHNQSRSYLNHLVYGNRLKLLKVIFIHNGLSKNSNTVQLWWKNFQYFSRSCHKILHHAGRWSFSLLMVSNRNFPYWWPSGLRPEPAADRLLELWVRIPPGAWMFVSCVAQQRQRQKPRKSRQRNTHGKSNKREHEKEFSKKMTVAVYPESPPHPLATNLILHGSASWNVITKMKIHSFPLFVVVVLNNFCLSSFHTSFFRYSPVLLSSPP